MQPRLKAGLWVRGQIAICQSSSIIAMIAHMGNEDAGAVLVKLNRFATGCFVYSRVPTLDGDMGWVQVAGGPDGGRDTEFGCDVYWSQPDAVARAAWDAAGERQTSG